MQGNVMQHPDSELPRQSVLVFIEVGTHISKHLFVVQLVYQSHLRFATALCTLIYTGGC